MAALTIGWEYLTGYAVATDPSDREQVEWPPHPARAFMAMTAAWFETDEDQEEERALQWLEALGDPVLHVPPRSDVFERSPVTVYVPVNDKAGPAAATLQCAPAFTRNRQARCFPRVWVGSGLCRLHWPDAPGVERHHAALDRLCSKVTRIGHSSSLVQMWLDIADESSREPDVEWLPDDGLPEFQVRQISAGMLDMLTARYGEEPRRRHAELTERIESLRQDRKAISGKGAKERKAVIDETIDKLAVEQSLDVPHPPVRPTIGLWRGYRQAMSETARCHSHFDSDLVVLKRVDGPAMPLVSSLGMTRAMRDMVMKESGVQPVPPWVSGHEADGAPLRETGGHLAIVPLPHVGGQHADGHLLGLGLLFPRNVERSERARVLGNVLLDEHGEPKAIPLTLGRVGVWTVQKREWSDAQQSLQPETWTAHPVGADTWASVTPVVLDRFPKEDREKNRAKWTTEVSEIIRTACDQAGLPIPVDVDIDTTSWHHGSPRAVAKTRKVRGQGGPDGLRTPFGDGFPRYPAKGTNASRPQVHVWLRFSEPVVGPILLGAGRYRGYGLFKPWKGERS